MHRVRRLPKARLSETSTAAAARDPSTIAASALSARAFSCGNGSMAPDQLLCTANLNGIWVEERSLR